MRINRN